MTGVHRNTAETENAVSALMEPETPEAEQSVGLPAQGTPEYDRMRYEGKICFVPRRIELEKDGVKTGEVCIQTHDQQVYSVGKGGTLRNLLKPGRMSKKERRKYRAERLAESPAPSAGCIECADRDTTVPVPYDECACTEQSGRSTS